jgi:hypothetical protein
MRPLLTACLALAAAPAAPLPSREPPLVLSRDGVVVVPIRFEKGAEHVSVWSSLDEGRSWALHAMLPGGTNEYRLQAERDGRYLVYLQYRGVPGLDRPPAGRETRPLLRALVDRRPPEVVVKFGRPRPGAVAVGWLAYDENLDLATLVVEARRAGGDWAPLDVKREASGQHVWEAPDEVGWEVRVTVRDLAGNEGRGSVVIPPARPDKP